MTKPAAPTDSLPAETASQQVAMPSVTVDRILAATAAAACIGVVIYKFALIRLLNVNWDEFFFLNHVHDLARGELALVLQGSYTHLFSWLLMLPGNEMQQIVAARYVMVALLGLTAWLIWRLARVWLAGFAALVAPFCLPVHDGRPEHGGSFRADSMLAPLSVAPLILLVGSGFIGPRDWLAGGAPRSRHSRCRSSSSCLHHWYRPPYSSAARLIGTEARRLASGRPDVGAPRHGNGWLRAWLSACIGSQSRRALGFLGGLRCGLRKKTLLDLPWFPRPDYFVRYFNWQPFSWYLSVLAQ